MPIYTSTSNDLECLVAHNLDTECVVNFSNLIFEKEKWHPREKKYHGVVYICVSLLSEPEHIFMFTGLLHIFFRTVCLYLLLTFLLGYWSFSYNFLDLFIC